MKKLLLSVLVLLIVGSGAKAQLCCNVVDGSGLQVSTKNGICVIAPNLLGDAGCPQDADGDGVNDEDDKCPEVAGVAEFGGCLPPDSDNDGIIDSEDKCPEVAGTVNGCPDTDGDGVIDKEDDCVSVAGTLGGCPDSDDDGVKDSEDNCPNIAGLAALSGCPDGDGDGVADKDDTCPTEAGLAANNGCPELEESEKEILKAALEGVNFVSGKDVLTATSKPKLDNVAKVLEAHPTYKLKVSGYTDSSGGAEANLELSKKRAAAVKAYLIEDGVEASRIFDNGYGEENPIADNGTSAGRAKNRRVEFEIVY